MTPNAFTVAAVVVPGTKKLTSVMLLPSAVNSRCVLNGAKSCGYVGSMLPKSVGAMPALALTWNPVPGVENTTPRGLFTLKKLAGRLLGADSASGTPSQLISLRTPPNEPLAPATVPPPIAARNASLVGVIPTAVPVPSNTIALPHTALGTISTSSTNSIQLFFICHPDEGGNDSTGWCICQPGASRKPFNAIAFLTSPRVKKRARHKIT